MKAPTPEGGEKMNEESRIELLKEELLVATLNQKISPDSTKDIDQLKEALFINFGIESSAEEIQKISRDILKLREKVLIATLNQEISPDSIEKINRLKESLSINFGIESSAEEIRKVILDVLSKLPPPAKY